MAPASVAPGVDAPLDPAEVALIRQKSSGTLARLLGSAGVQTKSGKGLSQKVRSLTDDTALARWWRRTRRRNTSHTSCDEIVVGLRGLLATAKLPSKYQQALEWCVENEVDSLTELKAVHMEEDFLTQGVGVKAAKYRRLKQLLDEYEPSLDRLSSSSKAVSGAL